MLRIKVIPTTIINGTLENPDFSGLPVDVIPIIQDAISSGNYEVLPNSEPIESIPEPDWDSFNATLITDPAYHQAVANIRASALPGLDTPVVVALGQVADKGVSSFSLAFTPFCEYGQVSIEQREQWAQLAESFNLPADFVAVIRG